MTGTQKHISAKPPLGNSNLQSDGFHRAKQPFEYDQISDIGSNLRNQNPASATGTMFPEINAKKNNLMAKDNTDI